MSNLVINANSIYDRVIRIGRQTENLVSSITFNLNMWIEEYGLGECVLNVRRNGDGSAYPVPMTITDGMTTWTITDTDTAKKGRGEIQLKYTTGEKVKTSPIFTISCGESLIGDGEPPSGYEDWLTEMNRMTAQVEAAKTSADQSAQTAQTAAETAAAKATEAEQSANVASGFANNASASAASASASAQAASQSEQAASVARTAAEAAAISAQAEADDAEAAKTAAQTAESNAQGFAQTATGKAAEAAESAANAAESVTDARTEADRAKTYADRATEVELEIPTKVSELENDAGYLTEHQSLADYVRKDVLYNMLPTDSASGAIASFTDGAGNVPLKSLVVGINPVQSGEGDPSPTNVRPITGWTGMTVNANGTEIPISWESEAGTVYGGTLDVVSGVLTVDRIKETFVFDNPTEDSTYNLESQRFTLSQRSTGSSNSTGKITNVCGAYAYAQANWHNGEPHFYVGVTSCILYLTKNTYRGGNVELCYPLETLITYQLTPHEVNSMLGQNNIYVDTGDTSVTYRADIQKWVEKKLSTRSMISLTRSMPVQTEETETELLE